MELRKRKAQTNLVQRDSARKKLRWTKDSSSKERNSSPTKKKTKNSLTQEKIPRIGDTIPLDTFGGEIKTHEGMTVTLKSLIDCSKSGVVLFTYPKASTPGCTTQVCLFRDSYKHLSSTGLSILGLSADSPKSNAKFKFKQNLPYPLLCDSTRTLISALGFNRIPQGTIRGVFAVDKMGKVLLLEAGGPAGTVNAVQKLVENTTP